MPSDKKKEKVRPAVRGVGKKHKRSSDDDDGDTKQRATVDLVDSDASVEIERQEGKSKKKEKKVKVEKQEGEEEYNGPTATGSEIDEALPPKASQGSDGGMKSALDKAWEEADAEAEEDEHAVPKTDSDNEAEADTEEPAVKKEEKAKVEEPTAWQEWIGKANSALKKCRALDASATKSALIVLKNAFHATCVDEQKEAIAEVVALCSCKVIRSITKRIGKPPCGCALSSSEDEEEEEAKAGKKADKGAESDKVQEASDSEEGEVLTTEATVKKILDEPIWAFMQKANRYKAKPRAAREVLMSDKSLRKLEGNSARSKLVAFVSTKEPAKDSKWHRFAADCLFLMLATKTEPYATVADLLKYLAKTEPADAMTHICMDVLNLALENDVKILDQVQDFHEVVVQIK